MPTFDPAIIHYPIHSFGLLLSFSIQSFYAHYADPMIRCVVVALKPGLVKAGKISSFGLDHH